MPRTRFLRIVLALIFIISSVLMVFSSLKDSQTTDEGVHLVAGYTYLKYHDFRLDPEHPPFLKELAALPLIFNKDIKFYQDQYWQQAGDYYQDSWQQARILGENFLYRDNSPRLIFLSRFVFIILTLILGWFTYFWGKHLYGEKAGIFASFLILFSPIILAHGRLINTDLGLSLFILVSVYFWGKFLSKLSWSSLILSGLFLGLALASKFTAVILLPILLVLLITKIIIDANRKDWLKYIGGFFGSLIIAFIIIWASYGFSIQVPPKPYLALSNEVNNATETQQKIIPTFDVFSFKTDFKAPTTFDKLFIYLRPVLVPANFYKGFILLSRHALGGHASYLLGKISITGWWYYFPIAILFKTSVTFFIFLAISCFSRIKLKQRFDEYLLIIPPLTFLILSMASKADLGIRHILPIFPFLFIYSSKSINLFSWQDAKKRLISVLLILLFIWYFMVALISFPNFIAYFNELAGGSYRGYHILTDSNLDWGQDIFRIKNYLDRNQIKTGYIVYPWDGEIALKYYGINLMPLLPENRNISGRVIISATYLETDAYNWLKKYPRKQITPGVFIFEVN